MYALEDRIAYIPRNLRRNGSTGRNGRNRHISVQSCNKNMNKYRTRNNTTSRVSDPHFFADPDPDPRKNLHADLDPDPDPDPDPGGIRGRGLGVKGKNEFFFEFFSRFR